MLRKTDKKFPKIFSSIIAIMLSLALLITCAGCKSKGGSGGGSDSGEKHSIGQAYTDGEGAYQNLLFDLLDGSSQIESEVTLNVSKDAYKLLKRYVTLPAAVNLDWLNSVGFKNVFTMNDGRYSIDMSVLANKKDLLSVAAILDSDSGNGYLGIPGLSSKYFKLPLGDLFKESFSGMANIKDYEDSTLVDVETSGLSELTEIFDKMESLASILPSDAELESLVSKYVEIALENVPEPESEKITLKVGGVEQECTYVFYTITEKDAINMWIPMFKELVKDSKIKGILKDYYDWAKAADLGVDISFDEFYEEFTGSLEEIIEASEEEAEEFGTDEPLYIELYTADDKVIGCEISFKERGMSEAQEAFSFLSAQNGNKLAAEINVADAFEVAGKGTLSSGKLSGEFSLTVQNTKLGVLEFDDFDLDAFKGGLLNGTIRLKPNTALYSKMGLPSEAVSLLKTFEAIELKFETTKNSAGLSLNLISSGKVFIGIDAKYTIKSASSISIPSKGSTCDPTNKDDVISFVKSINLNKFVGKLENIGVPSEWTGALRQLDTDDLIDLLEDNM